MFLKLLILITVGSRFTSAEHVYNDVTNLTYSPIDDDTKSHLTNRTALQILGSYITSVMNRLEVLKADLENTPDKENPSEELFFREHCKKQVIKKKKNDVREEIAMLTKMIKLYNDVEQEKLSTDSKIKEIGDMFDGINDMIKEANITLEKKKIELFEMNDKILELQQENEKLKSQLRNQTLQRTSLESENIIILRKVVNLAKVLDKEQLTKYADMENFYDKNETYSNESVKNDTMITLEILEKKAKELCGNRNEKNTYNQSFDEIKSRDNLMADESENQRYQASNSPSENEKAILLKVLKLGKVFDADYSEEYVNVENELKEEELTGVTEELVEITTIKILKTIDENVQKFLFENNKNNLLNDKSNFKKQANHTESISETDDCQGPVLDVESEIFLLYSLLNLTKKLDEGREDMYDVVESRFESNSTCFYSSQYLKNITFTFWKTLEEKVQELLILKNEKKLFQNQSHEEVQTNDNALKLSSNQTCQITNSSSQKANSIFFELLEFAKELNDNESIEYAETKEALKLHQAVPVEDENLENFTMKALGKIKEKLQELSSVKTLNEELKSQLDKEKQNKAVLEIALKNQTYSERFLGPENQTLVLTKLLNLTEKLGIENSYDATKTLSELKGKADETKKFLQMKMFLVLKTLEDKVHELLLIKNENEIFKNQSVSMNWTCQITNSSLQNADFIFSELVKFIEELDKEQPLEYAAIKESININGTMGSTNENVKNVTTKILGSVKKRIQDLSLVKIQNKELMNQLDKEKQTKTTLEEALKNQPCQVTSGGSEKEILTPISVKNKVLESHDFKEVKAKDAEIRELVEKNQMCEGANKILKSVQNDNESLKKKMYAQMDELTKYNQTCRETKAILESKNILMAKELSILKNEADKRIRQLDEEKKSKEVCKTIKIVQSCPIRLNDLNQRCQENIKDLQSKMKNITFQYEELNTNHSIVTESKLKLEKDIQQLNGKVLNCEQNYSKLHAESVEMRKSVKSSLLLATVVKKSRKDYDQQLDGSSYKLYTDAKNWNDARKSCFKDGAYLAVINSKAEEQLFISMLKNVKNKKKKPSTSKALIGVHDLYNHGEWVTILEEPLNSTGYGHWSNYDSRKRQTDKENEHCGALIFSHDSGMDVVSCESKFSYICELQISP